MDSPKSGPDQQMLAVAALAACIVQTLGENDQTFVRRFVAQLDDVAARLRESGSDCVGATETLGWVRELLKP